MKVLVLGGAGMLGHALVREWAEQFELHATFRSSPTRSGPWNRLPDHHCHLGVAAENIDSMIGVLARVRPDVVVNCIGIVKQQAASKDSIACLTVNSLFPHRLARLCQAMEARLVHISTDCVFSGNKGSYTEDDPSDALDLYGRSKFLGEVSGPGCLTLRTSIIGREIGSRQGLVEWFLAQAGGRVSGYTRAIFSGLTTLELARVIGLVLCKYPDLSGLWQVAGRPISKFDLLTILNQVYDTKVRIDPVDTPACDRSLVGDRFTQATGWRPDDWLTLLSNMRERDRATN